MSIIRETESWFHTTGQLPFGGEPNKRWLAFYLGMQLEELAEKLDTIPEMVFLATRMHESAKLMRRGTYDDAVFEAFQANPKAFLDSDGDLIWVTIGGAVAAGADLERAYAKINFANWDKEFPEGGFRLDDTGKVLKRDGWEPPDLSDCVHPSLIKGDQS